MPSVLINAISSQESNAAAPYIACVFDPRPSAETACFVASDGKRIIDHEEISDLAAVEWDSPDRLRTILGDETDLIVVCGALGNGDEVATALSRPVVCLSNAPTDVGLPRLGLYAVQLWLRRPLVPLGQVIEAQLFTPT